MKPISQPDRKPLNCIKFRGLVYYLSLIMERCQKRISNVIAVKYTLSLFPLKLQVAICSEGKVKPVLQGL